MILLRRLISLSNCSSAISRYVAFQHKELPAEAFTLKEVTIEDLKDYVGKDKYGVTLIIGDDEVDVDAPESDEAEESEEMEQPTEAVTPAEATEAVTPAEATEEQKITE